MRGAATFETKIRKVGKSPVITLSTEMLAVLDAKEGVPASSPPSHSCA
ncbi:MAG: hypothetical protein O2898_01380 [Proteobacteria bacterium]|nr:hypothetical protein [Pseudomonadota bacterium]